MSELPFDQIYVIGLRRELWEALKDLQDMAYDYSDGANGRFREQGEKCKQIKERLVYAEQLPSKGKA